MEKGNSVYRYQVSIIIPIYNGEKYLQRCITSIMDQTYPFEKIQVILINNNSVDDSAKICAGFAYEFENIHFYSEKEQGVSNARNTGIEHAEGKYIMFLDADDYISSHTVENVLSFFEKNADKVDLVTYHETRLEQGKKIKEHIRYRFLEKTGIYSLDENIYLLQVRLNICVKNNFLLRFDPSLTFQEDQKFCAEFLMNQTNIGYVKEAEYFYEVHNGGLVEKHNGPIQYFESGTKLFEDIFAKFESVPEYFQALFFHDCMWKFKSNRFWPFHYKESEFAEAKARIKSLLKSVEDSVIMQYPDIDIYEKLYWLRMKQDNITPIITEGAISLIRRNQVLYTRNSVEIILKKIRIDKKIFVRGFVKSTVFSFGAEPQLSVIVNDKQKDIEVRDCAAGYYKVKEKTNIFYGFQIEETLEDELRICFRLKINGILQKIVFYNMPTIAFDSQKSEYLTAEYLVNEEKDTIYLRKMKGEAFEKALVKELSQDEDVTLKNIKLNALRNKQEKIWLYTDSPSVLYDNGLLQFMHDVKIQDGIRRYYVMTNPEIQNVQIDNLDSNQIVSYGSSKHISLFFRAEKLLTSFSDEEVIWPFNNEKYMKSLRGLFNAEIIYLQHGVLHAHLPWYYSKYTSMVDKVVVSTKFEIANFVKNYDYRQSELIEAGMPRYDFLNREQDNTGNILFAPSWRSYLVGTDAEMSTRRVAAIDKIVHSSYIEGIEELLNDEKLEAYLGKNNLFIDVKMHPEFYRTYGNDILTLKSEHVRVADENVDMNNYALLITDFSSLLYDFVYMNKPIIYYIPDLDEFLSGMNHYRELDIPLEEGMGFFSDDAQCIVDYLEKHYSQRFRVEDKYSDKYDDFYLQIEDSRGTIYKALCCEESKLEKGVI